MPKEVSRYRLLEAASNACVVFSLPWLSQSMQGIMMWSGISAFGNSRIRPYGAVNALTREAGKVV